MRTKGLQALLYGNDPLPCPEFKRRDGTKCVNAEAAITHDDLDYVPVASHPLRSIRRP